MAPRLVRLGCMIFGGGCIVDAVAQGIQHDGFSLFAGLAVGSVWFAFGKYGGLPLVDTVAEWHAGGDPESVAQVHKDGLLVMRQRRLLMWISIPSAFLVFFLVGSQLQRLGHPEIVLLLLVVPLGFIHFRYYLSRCPRCGFGFFTTSKSRAAFIRRRKSCGHCGLSLYAYREPSNGV